MKHGRRRANIFRLWEWKRSWFSKPWFELWVEVFTANVSNVLNGMVGPR
jgi:hypothetical protein